MNFNDKEAAKLLGLAVQTLRNWRFLGKGPAYVKLGRRITYRLQDLETYLEQNRIDPERS
jgi:predicted site-specific integrase-resolvase